MQLRCPDCDASYGDRWRCRCGSPLQFADPPRPDRPRPDPESFDSRDGLWSFEAFLPTGNDPADRVTLGEGMTPLVAADAWDASFKLDYVFPTGSFKDRGATTTLTRAVELGVDRVVEDSSGNAGAAIATYAARAGIDAEIYVPADVKDAKLRAIRRTGADPVRVDGTREDVTDACLDAVRDGDAWYASHAWNPAFFAGTATFAYETAVQRGWSVPDAVVTPVGHGTLLLGIYDGFRALYDAGWTDSMPRIVGAQAAGVAPIVEALHGVDAASPSPEPNDAADGIQISTPVQLDRILTAIDETDGDAIAVTEPELRAELDGLHAAGFYTEPTCAVAPAALRTARNRGTIRSDDDVVVALTGSGLKG